MAEDTPPPAALERSLGYELHSLTPGVEIRFPPSLTLGGISCTIEGTVLTGRAAVDMHQPTARHQLETALQEWLFELDVDRGWQVEFSFTGSVWERPVAPSGERVLQLSGVIAGHGNLSASPSVTATAPLPPAAGTYRRTAEVDCCLERLRGVREGREPAPAAAYAMLSDLEARYGGRPGVRDALGVSRQVLDQVGRLAAGSHPTKARKTERPGKPQVALADADLMWL
jgi:hypothetical protein